MVATKAPLKATKKPVFAVVSMGKSETATCPGVNNPTKEIKAIGISFTTNVVDWTKEAIFVPNKLIIVILVPARMAIGINKFADK